MPTTAFLRNVPKVQLHCHLEGTVSAASFVELARRYGVPTSYRPGRGDDEARAPAIEDVYGFATFEEFLLTFAAVSRALRTPEDYGRVAREYARDAVAQNVMYGELFVSPSVWRFFHPDLDLRACIEAIRNALDEAPVRFALIVDLTRNFGPQSALDTARLAIECGELGVIGVGLGGDEAKFPPQLFTEAFALARHNGLHAVAHAGEAAGAHSVRDAIEMLQAERIGHGVRALEDPEVVQLLAEGNVPLEVCPTSNFLTGTVPRDRPHPLLELDQRGVIVTIDADDPALFRTSITDEYAYVASIAGKPALLRFIANAIESSFAQDIEKQAMRARLHTFDLEPARRA